MMVRVQMGQSLRDIALEYLGDHSLAHQIVKLNGLPNVRHHPTPGTMLEVGDPAPEKLPLTRWFVRSGRKVATAPRPVLIGSYTIGLDPIQ